ncbi:uncharacterized protein METZ01_LOCUS364741, partial [marine metagenome]
GTAEIDECGVCGGNNSSCADCAGVPNGSAYEDECDLCDDDPSNDCVQDCAGEWGGTLEIDICGVCDGDDTTCIPEQFEYNQSNIQGFYYFYTVTIDGDDVDAEDWVGAFNGDVCVGARKWDTSLCNNGVCDVPIMGDNGYPETDGYMQLGDIPTFKIFDFSANLYYNTEASETVEPFDNNNFIQIIENLNVSPDCNGDLGGDAVLDECYVCGGNGIANGECDCDGNIELGCGCGETGPSGCDNECGSTAEFDECGVCDGIGPDVECWDGSIVCDATACPIDCPDGTILMDQFANYDENICVPVDFSTVN